MLERLFACIKPLGILNCRPLMLNFAHCIINNKKSEASGEEGLIDMKIVDAIKRFADTGKKITMDW
jgi:predicted dehydrogenase